MKLFFLFCWLAFVSPDPYLHNRLTGTEQLPAVKNAADGYRTFQPSKIRKQKRKLRQRLNGAGSLIMLLSALCIAGVIFLMGHFWPLAGVFWRIFIVWLGVSLISGFLVVGLYGFAFSRQSNDKVHTKALTRLEKLGKKLPFPIEKAWCFPNEYYRISMGADKNSLLIIDYQQDKGWIIPKENIAEIRSDTVAADRAEALYPPGEGVESIVTQPFVDIRVPVMARRDLNNSMQVLQLECRDLPLRQMTLVYNGSVEGDNAQTIAVDLHALWRE